ncbi:hypothetical protein GF314_09260, partial [bacterium]|nr:hypothetical protein [bacterium]
MTRESTTASPAASPLLHLSTMLLMLVALAMPLGAGCEIVAPPESPPAAPDSDGQVGDDGDDDPIDRNQGPVVVQGSDYTLPDWAQPEPFAGYVDHPDAGAAHLGTSLRNRWVNWADLEPAHGVYDWSIIDRMLEEAEAGGYEVYLQIRSVTCGGGDPDRGVVIPNAVPAWVFDEFGLDDGDCINLGGEWQIEVVPAWREDVRTAFNDMIRAFGEAGYPGRSAFGGAYIHGISASRGEEFWLEPWQAATLESRAGFSASVLQEWIESRMDAYADAFGSRIDRVAWVGKVDIWHYCGQDYADVAWNLVQYAWDIGAGNRSSTVEAFHLSLEEPALGQWVDDQGYLHTDESIPPLADGRYFGDENEEYGEEWIWRFGDVQGDWQRYRFAMLR